MAAIEMEFVLSGLSHGLYRPEHLTKQHLPWAGESWPRFPRVFHRTGQRGDGWVSSGGYNYLTFLGCSFEASMLNRKEKNNPLC